MHDAASRVCYIHVGTHKTGTTAIQRFLAANATALAAGGTYYPRAARLSDAFPGHHNVAFELYDDARFDPSLGTLADVLAEIADADAPRVCLSSEDFEYLHARPALLLALRNAVEAAGYKPVVVIYLRAQSEYLESLYAEHVKHGSAVGFERFVANIVADGTLMYSDGFGLRFEYTKLVGPFAAVFGLDAVVVRPYADTGSPEDFVRDFVELVDRAERPAAFFASAGYEHTRPSVGDVLRWLFANTADELGCDEPVALAEQFAARAAASQPFAALSRSRKAAVAARFARDNAVLGRYWDLAALAPAAAGSARGWSAAPASRLFAQAETARKEFIARTTALRSGASG